MSVQFELIWSLAKYIAGRMFGASDHDGLKRGSELGKGSNTRSLRVCGFGGHSLGAAMPDSSSEVLFRTPNVVLPILKSFSLASPYSRAKPQSNQ